MEGTDTRNHPTISAAGSAMLERIRAHPFAPTFRNSTGSRLSASALEIVRTRTSSIIDAPWRASPETPAWMSEFVRDVRRTVPFFRARYGPGTSLHEIGTTSRADLAASVAQMVPDHLPLDDLIVYETSGVTGHRISVPSHPITAALYLAHHRRALQRIGVELSSGADRVSALLLGLQERCFTYASVIPMLGDAGFAKINLHPNDWRAPTDRAEFINALAPDVLSGDPVSFVELLALDVQHRPKALFSTSMALQPALRTQLEERFACPVLDFYSCNEIGPIAVFDPLVDAHVLLQPSLYVEILSASGTPLALGQRGEVTVTGGFNDYLPLLRYRTGDYASLEVRNGSLVLANLVGRAPVRFRTAAGTWINNHEVGHTLRDIPAAQFGLHQCADGSARLRFDGSPDAAEKARLAVASLLGVAVTLVVDEPVVIGAKVMQYTSDYPAGTL